MWEFAHQSACALVTWRKHLPSGLSCFLITFKIKALISGSTSLSSLVGKGSNGYTDGLEEIINEVN